MSTLEIVVLVVVFAVWAGIMGCIIWANLPDKEEKVNKVKYKVKLRKSKSYYIGRLEALEAYCSVSKEIKKRWGYAYIHLLGCKQNNQQQTKKQWKIRNSESYKLGWEDFANLKMKNIPAVCRICGTPKYDFYGVGSCKGCYGYNGSQDLLWRKCGKAEKQKSVQMQNCIANIFEDKSIIPTLRMISTYEERIKILYGVRQKKRIKKNDR